MYVAQAAAQASADGVSALTARAVGAYIGIGSGDYDALCRQHGVSAGAPRLSLHLLILSQCILTA